MSKNGQAPEQFVVTCDFAGFKARDLHRLNKSLQSMDIETAAGIISRFAVEVSWGGDAKSAETYLDLEFPGQWNAMVKSFTEGLVNSAKN